MSLAHYHGEQHSRHGGQLKWAGPFGYPVRGPVPLLSNEEFKQIPLIAETKHGIFDLSDEEQAKEYNWVRERAKNGWFIIDYIQRSWDDNKKNMTIYLEWTQIYGEVTKDKLKSSQATPFIL